jgi:hypothetical protein
MKHLAIAATSAFDSTKKTGNFKVAIGSRPIQWSALTEESKRMNSLHENDGKK